jgi:hypothetical protein
VTAGPPDRRQVEPLDIVGVSASTGASAQGETLAPTDAFARQRIEAPRLVDEQGMADIDEKH